jgi:hypothetical protein
MGQHISAALFHAGRKALSVAYRIMLCLTDSTIPKTVRDQIEVVTKELCVLEELLEKLEELRGIPSLNPKVGESKHERYMYFGRDDAFLVGIFAAVCLFCYRKTDFSGR